MLHASVPSGFASQDLSLGHRGQGGHPETPALAFHGTGRGAGEMGDGVT